MHEALSLNAKKLIAQNLPYFYQNSLKIFINLTDCWKKYGNSVMRYDILHDGATLEYQYISDCFTWCWPDREIHVYFNEV